MGPHSDAGRVAALVGLLFGLAGMGSAAVAVTLPAIAADLGLTTGGASWAISLYALMLAVATAVYGRVADLAGIRLPLLVGVGLMTGGAVLGAFAPSFEVLLGARLLQGTGAAAVPTLGMAIVSARYDGAVRTAALGRVAGMAAAVSALGPLAGGLVADLAGWRAVVALPALGLLVVPALWRAVPSQGTGARLDILGAVLVAGTAAGLVLLVQSPASGTVVATAGAVLLGLGVPAVAARVRRRPEGFLPRAVIHEPVVVRSALAASAVPAAWFALLIAVPAVLAAEGWTPLQVGLALVPSALTGFLAPRLAGPLLARLGPARSLVTSGITAAVALGGRRARGGRRVGAGAGHRRRPHHLRLRARPARAHGRRRRGRAGRRAGRRPRHRHAGVPGGRWGRLRRRRGDRRGAGPGPQPAAARGAAAGGLPRPGGDDPGGAGRLLTGPGIPGARRPG